MGKQLNTQILRLNKAAKELWDRDPEYRRELQTQIEREAKELTGKDGQVTARIETEEEEALYELHVIGQEAFGHPATFG